MITTFPRHLLLPRLSYRYIVQKKKKEKSKHCFTYLMQDYSK